MSAAARDRVLIATGDARTAKELEQACAARGLATQRAVHGAAALEASLAEAPGALVAAWDLDLIDAETLAGILRANPRTRGVRLLLLHEGVDAPHSASWDVALPADGPVEAVAARAERLLAERAHLDGTLRRAEASREVEGLLSQVSIPDLVQLFHLNRGSGALDLVRAGPEGEERGRIVLREGEVVAAAAGAVEGEKAFFRLLGWEEGRFAFTPGRGDGAGGMQTPTRMLLLEGARQQDECRRLERVLPALDERVRLRVPRHALPRATHRLTQEVLLLLEVHDRVRDLVDRCSFPDYQVLRALQSLADRGCLAFRPPERAAGSAPGGGGWFTADQRRRLRVWQQRRGGVCEPKLLVLSGGRTATEELVRVLRALPGLRLEGAYAAGGARSDHLGTLARLRLDADLELALLHVPTRPFFAPVWPLAAHEALGALVLLAPPVGEGAQRVRGALAALRELRGPRRIPVLLGGADAEEGARCEPLLAPAAPPLVLPAGGGRAAVEALCRGIAGLMP